MSTQPHVIGVGRLRPQAVSRHSAVAPRAHPRENRSSRATADGESRRETDACLYSRMGQASGFALMRDRLSFACPNESRQRKRHPGYASALRAEPLRCAGRRVWPELGSLWRSSNRLATSAQCAERPSALCFSFAPYGTQYRRLAHSVESLRLHAGIGAVGYVLVGLRPWLIGPTKAVTLSERPRACLYSGPLGAAPSSAEHERNKTAGCLSVSEFPAVPLAIRDGREPMQSIGARQGVFSLGYFSLDKQREVPRTSVRNPKPNFTPTVDRNATQARTSLRRQPQQARR